MPCWRQWEKKVAEDEMVRKCITSSMDMSLSKLWKTVEDREPWQVTFVGSQRVRHEWVTKQQPKMLFWYYPLGLTTGRISLVERCKFSWLVHLRIWIFITTALLNRKFMWSSSPVTNSPTSWTLYLLSELIVSVLLCERERWEWRGTGKERPDFLCSEVCH